MRLVCGKLLENERRMTDYNIEQESLLMMVKDQPMERLR